ncbi:hypothetical protein AWV80_03045 [Cupriavidus sp. UYMU48A]|nr:hypothetical protein AWV80_03045 [Cupriavidus sp. UYMU48A]
MSVTTALLVITAALSAMMLAIVWSLRRCGLPGVADWCNANLAVTMALVLFALRTGRACAGGSGIASQAAGCSRGDTGPRAKAVRRGGSHSCRQARH